MFNGFGHALELGHDFLFGRLPELLGNFNGEHRAGKEPMPWLAALVCASAFDLALHDAYGQANHRPTYETYCPEFLNRDLADFLVPADDADLDFSGKSPAEFLDFSPLGRP